MVDEQRPAVSLLALGRDSRIFAARPEQRRLRHRISPSEVEQALEDGRMVTIEIPARGEPAVIPPHPMPSAAKVWAWWLLVVVPASIAGGLFWLPQAAFYWLFLSLHRARDHDNWRDTFGLRVAGVMEVVWAIFTGRQKDPIPDPLGDGGTDEPGSRFHNAKYVANVHVRLKAERAFKGYAAGGFAWGLIVIGLAWAVEAVL